MQTHSLFKLTATLLLSLSLATAVVAEDQFKDVEIRTTEVGDGIYMLTGQGGKANKGL